MKNIIKIVLFIFISLIMAGCGSATGPTPSVNKSFSSSSVPGWYLNNQRSNSIYYYGVGEGSSKDRARANALVSISETMATSISANTKMSSNDVNGNYNESTKRDIKTSVDKIKFTGISVLKNEMINGKFFVSLSVDRDVLFQDQKKEFDIIYKPLVSLYQSAKQGNIFELIKKRDEILKNIDILLSKLSILYNISPDFDDVKYINKLTNIKNNVVNATKQAKVYIKNISNAKIEVAILQKYITDYGMIVISSPRKVKNKNNLMIVEVRKSAQPKTVKSSNPRLQDAFFADVTISITTKSANGNIIAKNIISVLNISKAGYKNAVAKTAKFEREITRRGIFHILLEKTN